ncbi:MAG: DUF4062 domain-containing protein [Anaerolineaceae bacterium]|nr:MAG: DUF4062 domain-containing protein [Anaerolineaceae bacterium]
MSTPSNSNPKSERREVRIFLSSTFLDMHAEREELIKFTFPELRKKCRERQVELVEVDLRWGVTEEQAERGEVLPICLTEIENCRPYFVGLLGERYGWVPEAIDNELCREHPWLVAHRGKSVTELEIIHGVLDNPGMDKLAFFFFRVPETSGKVEKALAALPDYQPEPITAKTKLATLKEKIRQSGYPVHAFIDAKALGQAVLDLLWPAIDRRFPAAEVPTPLKRMRLDHEAFAQVRTKLHIGRTEYIDELEHHVEGNGPPLVLLGEAGVGKSALIANWAVRHCERHPGDFMILHFTGSNPDSGDYVRLLRRIMEEIEERYEPEKKRQAQPGALESRSWAGAEVIPNDPRKIVEAFPFWLAKAAARGRLILVLDGLNQFEDRDNALDLGWLPTFFPENVRVIISTLPGRSLDALKRRGWPELTISPLGTAERKALIRDYLAQYRKNLSEARSERIAAAEQTANPLYLKTLLEELRVFGIHQELDHKIDQYLAARDAMALFVLVLQRLETDYDQDHPGLVQQVMRCLWAARHGLSETELLDIIGVKPPYWFPLYRALEGHLVNRSGLLNFAHNFLRSAIMERFLQSYDFRDKMHRLLAEYFARQDNFFEVQAGQQPPQSQFPRHLKTPNRRKVEELPWQRQQVVSYVLDMGLQDESQSECRQLVELITNPSFIEAKCSASLVYDLVNDYEDALRVLPKNYRENIASFSKIVSVQGEWLSKYPQTAKQQLTNHLKRFPNTCIDASTGAFPSGLVPKASNWLALFSERPPTTRLPWRSFTMDGAVLAVSLDADGRRVFMGSTSGAVHVGDTHTGEVLCRLTKEGTAIRAVALSSNGLLALTCSVDGVVQLFDTTTGGQCRWVVQSNVPCTCCAIEVREKYALVGCRNGEVLVIEIASGQILFSKRLYSSVVWCDLGLFHMGPVVVIVQEDSSVMLFKFDSKELIARFKGALNFHPLAATIVEDTEELVCVFSNNEAWRWSIKERLVKSVDQSYLLDLRHCSLSKHIAAFVPRRSPFDRGVLVKLLDQPARVAVACVAGGPVSSIAISRNGNAVVTGTVAGTVQVWLSDELLSDESSTSQKILDGPFDLISSRIVFCGTVSEDHFLTIDQKGVTALWSFKEVNRPKKVLYPHELGEGDVQTWDMDGKPGDKAWSAVQGAFTHQDGTILGIFRQSGQVVTCDLVQWREINRWETFGWEILAGAITNDVSRIICVKPSSIVSLKRTGGETVECEAGPIPIVSTSIAFMDKGVTLIAGLHDGSVCIWSDGQKQIEPVFKCSSAVTAIALASSGWFAWGTEDGELGVAKVEKMEHMLLKLAHRGRVNSCVISPDGRWVASVDQDSALLVHSMPDLELSGAYPLPDVGTALCWSKQADRLVVGTRQGHVEVLKTQEF